MHTVDDKNRVDRNYYHGWNHTNGDFLCYSPKFPYKGEGSDFYALYYEHFMRQDQFQGRSSAGSKIQFWTPNDKIFSFPYANEVALDECQKRGIEVFFGWEMLSVKFNEYNEKVATFKNVKNGETIEKTFQTASINPPSKQHKELVDAGIADADGGVDVNKYTLQHKKFENIFAFGDCVSFDTTRTQAAAFAQNPIVKHNVQQFLNGKECNAIYDGYTFLPFILGYQYATSFSHLHDFEPHANNHWVPHYGVFAGRYFKSMLNAGLKQGEKYSSFKKNAGPPHWHFSARYDDLEQNEYLAKKGVDLSQVKMFEPKVRVEADHH